ncbi:MAG: dihydropteroate synthase, partial [Chloroflexota bacterium]
LLDVGGDSAGGSAASIGAAEETRRVAPVIRALARQVGVPIAVDTHRAATAAAALDAGAAMVNDITALGDPAMAATVARGAAGLCLMHLKGRPKAFPPDFAYRSLVGDIARFLEERTDRALGAGIPRERLVVDPGIEFGKLLHQDLELLRRLPEFRALGYPLLVAVSRKHFIGNVLGLPPEERLEGTAAAVAFSIFRGAHMVRVHDVQAMVRVTRMAEALLGYTFGEESLGQQRSDGVVVGGSDRGRRVQDPSVDPTVSTPALLSGEEGTASYGDEIELPHPLVHLVSTAPHARGGTLGPTSERVLGECCGGALDHRNHGAMLVRDLPTDVELVVAAQAGDPGSLAVLLERHRAGMHAVALSILGYGPDAEDALQDAVVVALRRIGELRDAAAAGPWLHAIVRNACRMRLRATHAHRAEPLGDPVPLLPSAEPSPEEVLDRQ